MASINIKIYDFYNGEHQIKRKREFRDNFKSKFKKKVEEAKLKNYGGNKDAQSDDKADQD
jgi:hypothetical protein